MRKLLFYFAAVTLALSPHWPAFAAGTAESLPATAAPSQQSSKLRVDDVEALVVEFLQQQAASYPGSAHITVGKVNLDRRSECDDNLQVFLPGSQRLRARMSVGLRCLSPSWTMRVQATLAIHGFFYVPNRTLEPGESVSLDDLIAREGDILSLPRGVAVDPSHIIDQVVTQRIPAGTPIKARSLRSPLSIQRGQMVRTQARGVGFVITGEGQSLEDGEPGEQIRIRASSGQIISGVVLDAHTVQVMM